MDLKAKITKNDDNKIFYFCNVKFNYCTNRLSHIPMRLWEVCQISMLWTLCYWCLASKSLKLFRLSLLHFFTWNIYIIYKYICNTLKYPLAKGFFLSHRIEIYRLFFFFKTIRNRYKAACVPVWGRCSSANTVIIINIIIIIIKYIPESIDQQQWCLWLK